MAMATDEITCMSAQPKELSEKHSFSKNKSAHLQLTKLSIWQIAVGFPIEVLDWDGMVILVVSGRRTAHEPALKQNSWHS